ncbi:MBL fold metallo-hydrolase [Candidatus Thorarchaeota archaeon]|nr:MAG: MBL fold metallo-hydrolase [Candidatus Thorarchaeota archaeon]
MGVLWVIHLFDKIADSIYFLVSRSFDSNITFIQSGDYHVLVDAGTGMNYHALDKDLQGLGSSLSQLTDIVLTHSHIDHIGGVIPIVESGNPKIHLHKAEGEPINEGNMSQTLSDTFGVDLPPLKIEGLLEEGSILEFGDITMQVYHTPGHSLGSICLDILETGILITGDTLFPGGSFGRTDFPTGDERALVESLRRISEMTFEIGLPGHMNAMKFNAKKSALASYQMAKSMFRL